MIARHHSVRLAFIAGAMSLVPFVASAQSSAPAAPAPAQGGPFTVERVQSGGMIAPDVRITDVNGETATLLGAYGGWVNDNTLLIGAGGYWLANRSDTLKMAYGGLVVGWLARADRPIGFGVRGLIGGGTATIGTTLGELYDIDDSATLSSGDALRFGSRGSNRDRTPVDNSPLSTRGVLVREDYFVAEPQVNVLFNFTDRLRLNLGVGYRLIANAGPANELLRGPSGSVSFEWGGGGSSR